MITQERKESLTRLARRLEHAATVLYDGCWGDDDLCAIEVAEIEKLIRPIEAELAVIIETDEDPTIEDELTMPVMG